ncbi:MAG: YkgJ family cysteine cluster protein [Desulfobaccales bacterium]
MTQESDEARDRVPLSSESRFRFHCHSGLECFNRCCRKATVILSPYDILRLSRNLGLATGEFLSRYTRRADEGVAFLPLVLLKPARTGGCPFLGEAGCTVYRDRPAACRLFPVTQGSELTPEGAVERFFLRRLEYCRGLGKGPEWTLDTWLDDQGFPQFDRPRRPWLNLLAKQAQSECTLPDNRILSQFYMVAYDLDAFRVFVRQSAFLQVHGISDDKAKLLESDDLALLRLSAAYLEHLLFPTEAAPLTKSLESLR